MKDRRKLYSLVPAERRGSGALRHPNRWVRFWRKTKLDALFWLNRHDLCSPGYIASCIARWGETFQCRK